MSPEFARIARRLGKEPAVESTRMFGSDALRCAGKVFAMEVRGALVVKLASPRASALVETGAAEPFDPGHGRPMKQWVAVPHSRSEHWTDLAAEALRHARETGAKRPTKGKRT